MTLRTVLITGGALRIGRELSLQLAADGWHVLVHCRRSRADADAVVRLIEQGGGVADVLCADLERLDEVERLAVDAEEAARRRGSRLTALVNNASQFDYDTLDRMTADSWDRHIDVNLRAPIFLTRRFAAAVADGDDGCVINILDNRIAAPNPDYFSYGVAKLGLSAATGTLALALAPRLRVCGIAPGITLVSGDQTAEAFRMAHRANPMRRGCTVDQIAMAVRFILGARSLTGQTIVIDGGQSLENPGRDVAFLAD